jgi:hypothetical protein
MTSFEFADMSTPEGRAKVEAYEREKAESIRRGQQIYAKIKRSSKYYYQNEWAQADPNRWGGYPFPVFVEAGDPAGYVVQGGPGGQYRLADVNHYVIDGGRELRIA